MEIINVFFLQNLKCCTNLVRLQRLLSEQMWTFEGANNSVSSRHSDWVFFPLTVYSSLLLLPVVWKCILSSLSGPSFIHSMHLNSSSRLSFFSLVFMVFCCLERKFFRSEVRGLRGWLYFWWPELVQHVRFPRKNSFRCLTTCLYIY